ncbi:facilitated trehalose transporter Tret1-2 homolog [Venturia canescens]|uniref:facilitated trehalose transporter Tret1-2 homolog n=1 Tax=Venturia canescens TaxID=32260 RepID=UPI001C9D4B2D|nr:facilitated trehalose transporter Tret1-2 homolog [Venturia canescens]
MRLELERKESDAPGGCEGGIPADGQTIPHNTRNYTINNNNNNNNSNNNNNNNNSDRNSNHSRGYGESESHRRDQNELANEGSNDDASARRSFFLRQEEDPTQRTTLTMKDTEMRIINDKTRIIDPEQNTTIILPKSQENGTALEPMLGKTKISKNKIQEGNKLFQCLSTLIAGLMAMQAGMTLGWTSPILPYLKSEESFLLPGEVTDTEESWICSLLAVGAILGAVPAGKVADMIGRKSAIIVTSVPFLISWLMLIFLRDLTSVYVARFIGGIGAGAACVTVPVYIGEIAEASIRGALGSFFPLLFSLGIVFVYVAGAYASYTLFNVTCSLALLPFFAFVYLLPESPMWLVHRNLMKRAAKSLGRLRGKDYDVKTEIGTLRVEADRLENRRGGLRDLVGTRAGRKALVTCVGLMWFQQMSGIDAVLFYTVSIFQDAGSTIEPYIATIIIGIVEVVMSIVVAAVIDRFGRKPLLILSGSAMTLCLGVLGYYFHLKASGNDVSSIGWLPLTCLSMFNVVFSLGYGSVPFAVISELFPPETKGVASSISIMTNWSLVFTVTKIFPTMVEYLGQAATFWTFASMTAMSAVFPCLLVPETKGKTLQEIQTKLEIRKGNAKLSTVNDKQPASCA